MIRLYSDRSHYAREHRGELSDLLRPYWKDMAFSDAQRRQMYGVGDEDFFLVDNLSEADLAVLPMTWNFYVQRGELGRAGRFIEAARHARRPILSYVSGDEGVKVPAEFDDVWVVRASGCRSRKRARQVAQPVFFEDPLKRYPELGLEWAEDRGQRTEGGGQRSEDRGQWSVVSSPLVPKVGFCGQASASLVKIGWDLMRGLARNAASAAGVRWKEAQPVYPPALLRTRAMELLEGSPLVETRFVVRDRYRGGANDAASREQTTREFYANIAGTDYTLCVRGGGNFSKRFYETLATGRIPLLIDTDCLLPFDREVDWSEYILVVPQSDLWSLPERVARDFKRYANGELAERKHTCRQFWQEHLTFAGFHRRLMELLFKNECAVASY